MLKNYIQYKKQHKLKCIDLLEKKEEKNKTMKTTKET